MLRSRKQKQSTDWKQNLNVGNICFLDQNVKRGAGEGLNKGGNIIRELKRQLQFFKSPFKDNKKKEPIL